MADNVPFVTPGTMYGRNSEASPAATTGGDTGANKLWLPIWSGEVMRAFDQYRMFEGMVESRTISSGRVMEFPVTGTVAMKPSWGAGEELIGGIDDSSSTTFAVSLDARPIASHFELDNVDLMISQWEFRSELARQAGQTLANARDSQVGAFIARAGGEVCIATDPRLAAQSPAATKSSWRNTLKDAPIFSPQDTTKANLSYLGVVGSSDTQRTDAALELLACIEEFTVHLQEINAPTDGVYCAVTPQVFQDIRTLGVARESGDLAGGVGRPMFGGVAEGGGLGLALTSGLNGLSDSMQYMGCTIVKTTHIVGKDHQGANDAAAKALLNIGEARYNGDFSTVGAMIWQKSCVASLNQTGLKVDTVDDVRRNSVFTVASVMGGTGVLRPECCSLVMTTALTTGTNVLRREEALTHANFMGLAAEFAATG